MKDYKGDLIGEEIHHITKMQSSYLVEDDEVCPTMVGSSKSYNYVHFYLAIALHRLLSHDPIKKP